MKHRSPFIAGWHHYWSTFGHSTRFILGFVAAHLWLLFVYETVKALFWWAVWGVSS